MIRLLPFVLIVGGLVTWGVARGERHDEPSYRSVRVEPLFRATGALRTALADLRAFHEKSYETAFAAARDRHASTGKTGRELQQAIEDDAELSALARASSPVTPFVKIGAMFCDELEMFARKLAEVEDAEAEALIWQTARPRCEQFLVLAREGAKIMKTGFESSGAVVPESVGIFASAIEELATVVK